LQAAAAVGFPPPRIHDHDHDPPETVELDMPVLQVDAWSIMTTVAVHQ